ncbi:rhodanese-related sulfurtransferase [Candidatus Nomurabacteria bacterium]|nr:rhodanese-related sulfurtransferase [Candidatus Nomurabacteria bacterium]MCB9820875.1 rhodanese-related sulfurtransferase [Candidatus Nomurabacteria bacterium]
MEQETQKNSYKVLLFYKYVFIEDPEKEKENQRSLQASLGLLGRTIVSKEGINVTLEGLEENTTKYMEAMKKDPRFVDIHWKVSDGDGKNFRKLSVKVRDEIVTLGLGVCDVDPNMTTGVHLKPEELHKWFTEGKEFYIVDMRNVYEHKVGKFEGSICPPLNNFRDLPKMINTISHLKDKTVLTVCTGGVRCEKASGYLITQGFTDVYQLDGGIVSYMEKYPNENFKGKLYVFDNRKVMGFYTDDPKHEVIGRCEKCDQPCEQFTNCADMECHSHFICCDQCLKKNDGKVSCPSGCHYDRSGNKMTKGIFTRFLSIFK